VKELGILDRKISYLERNKIGRIAPDLYAKRDSLRQIKTALLVKTPLLAGERIEKLLIRVSSDEKIPNELSFRNTLTAELKDYLTRQREHLDVYNAFLAGKEGVNAKDRDMILADIFESGLAESDLVDLNRAEPACHFLANYRNDLAHAEFRRDIINASLVALPLMLGEMGLAGRALAGARLASWGEAATESSIAAARSLSLGAAVGLSANEIGHTRELGQRCMDEYIRFGTRATEDAYKRLLACRDQFTTQRIVSIAAAGLTGAAVLGKIAETVAAARLQPATAAYKLRKDLGIGSNKMILRELDEIKKTVEVEKLGLAGVSRQIVNKESDINRFFGAQGDGATMDGHRVVAGDRLTEYVNTVGNDSAELLYVPGSQIKHLPNGINRVGHMALRVGDKVYHQTGGSGFRIESLENFLNVTKKDYRVYGTVIQISPRERAIMSKFLTRLHDKQLPYSFLLNNCSQVACRAMELAEVDRSRSLTSFDPALVETLLKRSRRVTAKTVYNADRDLPTPGLRVATTATRAVYYGAPVTAGVAAGYAGVSAIDSFLDYLDKLP